MPLINRGSADLSTAHVEPRDCELLKEQDDDRVGFIPLLLVYSKREYGYFVFTETIRDEPERADELLKAGFSQLFVERLVQACDEGFKWLELDRDGEEYADLPQGTWL